jgi:hypothetical protein
VQSDRAGRAQGWARDCPQLATPREFVDDPSHPFSSAGDEALPCEVDRGLAWVDLFERIDVDNHDEKAVAVWKAAPAKRVSRSDSGYEWLRR